MTVRRAMAIGQSRLVYAVSRAEFDANLTRHAGIKKAGLGARLSILDVAIRILLQVKFLPSERTQNSPDLAAIHRTLVGRRHRTFHLFRYGIELGGRTVQCRPVLVINDQVNVRIIFAARLY